MAINLKNLQSKTVSEATADSKNSYIYVLNIATNIGSKVLLNDVIKEQAPIIKGRGASIFKSMETLKMNLRSITSSSTFLNIRQLDNTIDFTIKPTFLDLSVCNNNTSGFLTTVDLTTNVGTTILPVANGGTGVSTLTDGGILLGSGTGEITAMDALAAGTIIYGDGTTDPSTLGIGTAGQVLTVNSGATAPEWAAATNVWNGTATSDLNMANYDINLGTGWLSGDGTHEGININSAGKVFMGAGTPTAFFDDDVNIMSETTIFTAPGGGNCGIRAQTPASAAGYHFDVSASSASASNTAGGNLTLYSGGGNGTGAGGTTVIKAGVGGGSGATGDIQLWGKVGSVSIPTLVVEGNTSRVSIQSGAATSVTPDAALEINQQSTTAGIPCLTLDQDDIDYAFLKLDGSAGDGTGYNLDTEPAADTSASTVAAPHSAAWTMVGMVKILVGSDVRYLPYYSKVS